MASVALKMAALAMLILTLTVSRTCGQTMDDLIAGAAEQEDVFNAQADLESDEILTEMDMKMTQSQYDELHGISTGRSKRKATKKTNKNRWPQNTIRYTIAAGVFSTSQRSQINLAIKDWENYTCLKFVQTTNKDDNRIFFDNGRGCYSYVGRVGGTQPIGLAPGCRIKGIIVHEIGHAVGFHHEQNRPDRDNYVTIMKQNIPASVFYNFKKYSSNAIDNYGVPYDYRSVMHYGGTAFSQNGRLTIKTRDSRFQNVIGNRKGLSFRDIKLANLMYSCNKECPKKSCPGEGFVGKDCKCWCPGEPYQVCGATTGTTPKPKPTTPAPTVKPSCKDLNKNCLSWKEGGYCDTNSYVKIYCKKTCGTCSGGGTSNCKDKKTSCTAWAKRGYCKGTYEIYMSRNCPKSCKTCKMLDMSEQQYQDAINEAGAATVGVNLVLVTMATALVSWLGN